MTLSTTTTSSSSPRALGRARAAVRPPRRLWLLAVRLLTVLAMAFAPAPVVAMTMVAGGGPVELEHEVPETRAHAPSRAHAGLTRPKRSVRVIALPRGPRAEAIPEPHAARWIVPPQRKTLLRLHH